MAEADMTSGAPVLWDPPAVRAARGLDTLEVDVAVVAIAPGEPLGGPAAALDTQLDGLLSGLVTSGEQRAALGEVLLIPTGGPGRLRRVLLCGVGPRPELDGQRLRLAVQRSVRAAHGYGYRRIAVLAGGGLGDGDLTAAVEGAVAGAWERDARRSGNRRQPVEVLTFAGFGEGREAELAVAARVGAATAQAREWQNAPANELWPERLAEIALAIADETGAEAEVLREAELREGGYRLLLGVGAGSARPPRLIRLVHRGRGSGPMLGLLGKGITFDAGGLSIKTAAGMVRMRGDMAGAAAVLAAFRAIAAERWPVDVMAVVPASENLLGPEAQKPGDVLTSAAGRTVEILNTDAEGRLVLADAMTYAIRSGATHLVDLATLTGSARVAIGHTASAALASDDVLWAQVERASARAGERVWRLPIYPELRELLRSPSADLRNSDYGEAGTITGGLFIGEFAEGR
ncbi:MAG: M17 family peptidase N-terminal domain-containing protein, partial [Candidatus Dormiibacterota bacterium]